MHLREGVYFIAAAVAVAALQGCGDSSNASSAFIGVTTETSNQYPTLTCEEGMVPVRDGTKMKTYVYRSNGFTKKAPIILLRSKRGLKALFIPVAESS